MVVGDERSDPLYQVASVHADSFRLEDVPDVD